MSDRTKSRMKKKPKTGMRLMQKAISGVKE